MGRHIQAICRLCRREGGKLFLKGEKCYSEKCPVQRRSYAPGQHGKIQVRASEYQIRLREKQKARRIYGLSERQFSNYFAAAARRKGDTGEQLLQAIERRLDNVVYQLGFATSRQAAILCALMRWVRSSKTTTVPMNSSFSSFNRERFT